MGVLGVQSGRKGRRSTAPFQAVPARAGAPLTLRASPVCALLLLLGAREGRSSCAARVICWLDPPPCPPRGDCISHRLAQSHWVIGSFFILHLW